MKQSLVALLVRAYVFPNFPASFEDQLRMIAFGNTGTHSFWEYTKMHSDFLKRNQKNSSHHSAVHRTGKRHK